MIILVKLEINLEMYIEVMKCLLQIYINKK